MRPVVQEFKLQPPPRPPHLQDLPRLVTRLDAATEPLIVISAPAGAGKTTLLAEWSESARARGECAWLTLDVQDNAPDQLFGGIAQALRKIRPETPMPADHGGSAGWTLGTWAEDVLSTLVTRDAGQSSVTLVLDGLEAITDTDPRRALSDFLTRLPQGFRLVLSTRHVPGAPVPVLRC
ncbi:AAA family ATPase [Streptomyces sp. NPDC002758]